MRGLFTSVQNHISSLALYGKEIAAKHWFNATGGSMNGIYLMVPFARLSMWIERHELSVGFGHERDEGNLEVFAGRFQAVFCVEPRRAR